MASGFSITEETSDREYFTIIPNYIINHSTIWERDIYLIMKRIAGEKGNCYASHQTIAEETGVSRPTISRTIQKLIKRGWIKETGKVAGKTHPTKNYEIVDLWSINSQYYKDQKKRKLQNQSIENVKDTSTTEPKIRKPQIHKEEYNNNNNNNIILHSNGVAEKEINSLIEYFKPLNPSYKMLYKNKTQRDSLKRLIDLYGVEKVLRMLEMLPGIVSQPYAPRITTPYQLETKLGELRLFMQQKKNKGGGTIEFNSVELKLCEMVAEWLSRDVNKLEWNYESALNYSKKLLGRVGFDEVKKLWHEYANGYIPSVRNFLSEAKRISSLKDPIDTAYLMEPIT